MTTEGKAWVLGDNVSGDHIISKEFIAQGLSISELKRYLFYACRQELGALLKPGDVLAAGENFGCGSSREYVMLLLKDAGIHCIIARSFARGFYRACVNQGLLPIECKHSIREGECISVNAVKGTIESSSGSVYAFSPFPDMISSIIREGGLVNYYRQHGSLT